MDGAANTGEVLKRTLIAPTSQALKRTHVQSVEFVSKLSTMKIEIPKPPPEKRFGTYVAVTIVVNVGIFLASQLYGYYGWPDTQEPIALGELNVHAQVLKTYYPWYKKEYPTSPSSSLEDDGFLRYATFLLWLTVITTGLGMELVIGEPLVRRLGSRRGT